MYYWEIFHETVATVFNIKLYHTKPLVILLGFHVIICHGKLRIVRIIAQFSCIPDLTETNSNLLNIL